MNPLDVLDSINWKRVGKIVLRDALAHAAWLLRQGGQFEKACGEKLQELSNRIKPG